MNFWWRIWWLALAIKLIVSAMIPITPDEAYYWVWSQNLQLSYYDHPPMIAVLMWLGELLTPWAVRWPSVILAHCGFIFWRLILKPHLSPKQEIYWFILALLMPLTGPGGLVATPDLPLMFTWALALHATHQLETKRQGAAFYLGFALGLAALSKYVSVLLIPIILLWAWRGGWFQRLLKSAPTIAAIALLVASPLLVWNFQNEWISFRFQLDHGLGSSIWKPKWTYEYVLVQFALIFPSIFILALSSRRLPIWLLASAWLPLMFFFFTSFRGYVEANWPIMAHPAVLALAIHGYEKHKKYWLLVPAILWSAGFIFVLAALAVPQLNKVVQNTKLAEVHRFHDLIESSQSKTPLFARSYQMASQLSFELKRPIPKLAGMNRKDFFDTLPGAVPKNEKFYIWIERGDQLPSPYSQWTITVVQQIKEKYELLEVTPP